MNKRVILSALAAINDLAQYQCQCEHTAHFERNARTPNGNPGHVYAAPHANVVTVKTSYGKFNVCPSCIKDCMAEQIETGGATVVAEV